MHTGLAAGVLGKCRRLSQYLAVYEHVRLAGAECLTVHLITLFRVTGRVRVAGAHTYQREVREKRPYVPRRGSE